jgi:hypothetical protein
MSAIQKKFRRRLDGLLMAGRARSAPPRAASLERLVIKAYRLFGNRSPAMPRSADVAPRHQYQPRFGGGRYAVLQARANQSC